MIFARAAPSRSSRMSTRGGERRLLDRSAADEMVVTPSGRVGSIGVFGVHDDVRRDGQARRQEDR
jgi:hypothetical protein